MKINLNQQGLDKSTKYLDNIVKKYLHCPSDGSLLIPKKKYLKCKTCLIDYPITKEGIINFIPNYKKDLKLSDMHKKWRDRSFRKANSDEYKRSKEGTLFEKLYHTLRLKNYKKIMEKYAPSPKAILDIGISTGYPTKIHPPCDIFFALDINLINLQRCWRYMRSDLNSKLMVLVRGDAYNLPFKKESLDLITIFTTLHRLNDLEVFLHLSNFLKTNGRLIVSVPWKHMILWDSNLRKFLWKIKIFSDSKEIRDSFVLDVKRYSKKEFTKLSTNNLKCIALIYPSHLTELVGVYQKIDNF